MMSASRSIEFALTGRYALFTDPTSRIGGEKCSYHIPTYEALKGVTKSIYWKPSLIWIIDAVRVMKPVRTQTKGAKPLKLVGTKGGADGHDLSIYTFLVDVRYHVRAHFEWNMHRPELAVDRITKKHAEMVQRALDRGGRYDIFLGTRDCQGYVEACNFQDGKGAYDGAGELAFPLMLHGIDYPDETGTNEMRTRFWRPTMVNGRIRFPRPENCTISKFVRPMSPKRFVPGRTFQHTDAV
jgi:CRISPR-associated protein Cas5d